MTHATHEPNPALIASYALSRHVPAMARGFSICTHYGELAITDEEAKRHPAIIRTVKRIMEARLKACERVGGAA
ncbi:hypothetical protein CO610_01530 [Lysobacteraceae bacterium NML95-0200]|nr:hypothetical protein CO610_01530 [Xanthomonadaceae bacterium NML95-0200]